MKEHHKSKKSLEITPPENFTHFNHITRSDTVDNLVHALQTRVIPLDSYGRESVPLPRKATSGSNGGGTLPRNGLTPTTFSPTTFTSSQSTSNLHRDTVSSGYGTWNAGAKGKIKRANLPKFDLSPKSQAPPTPVSPAGGQLLTAPSGGRHYRSVSASNDDAPLHTIGYVNVRPGQPFESYEDPHARFTHAANEGYLSPYVVIKPQPPPHRPSSSASPSGKTRSSTTSTITVKQEIDVIFRPPREVAPPPPRDSHHETDANTQIAAPNRITIQLARPTDLFGPGPGLGLGLGALGSGSIGIDEVVPLPCPGSLDSGVSEPPFPAPAPQTDPAPPTSISPEEVKEYLSKLRNYYSELKDSDQLDSEGYIQRENLLKPAAKMILEDLERAEAAKKKRPAPPPPVDNVGASDAYVNITPTARPVPKPRTTKPASASSSGAATPVDQAATPTPPAAPAAAAANSLEARFNALPEAAVQLDPSTLKLAPANSKLAKVLPSEDEDDEEMTRL